MGQAEQDGQNRTGRNGRQAGQETQNGTGRTGASDVSRVPTQESRVATEESGVAIIAES
jgi:hypothetical protein